MTRPALKLAVRSPEKDERGVFRIAVPKPDTSYEWKDRQRIRSRDWAAVHIAADRRAPVALGFTRFWRR